MDRAKKMQHTWTYLITCCTEFTGNMFFPNLGKCNLYCWFDGTDGTIDLGKMRVASAAAKRERDRTSRFVRLVYSS